MSYTHNRSRNYLYACVKLTIMKTLNNLFIAGAVALMILPAFVSCRKKEDTIAKIYVRGASNEAISGATVRLMPSATMATPGQSINDNFPMVSTSNTSGEAIFNFNEVYQLGQAGVVVIDINVQKGSASGQGIIKVDQETTSEETVFIQ